MRLPRRRTFGLCALLLLVIVAGNWLLAGRSRITQANFDRIKDGMTLEEIKAILGDSLEIRSVFVERGGLRHVLARWSEGPNRINIQFTDDRVRYHRTIDRSTPLDYLRWHARKVAIKIGVKWD